ncbi:Uncharacterised protein [uncultured Comamonas sp.]|nr:Uncharacterised protein [uncultured Comamonas sp.]
MQILINQHPVTLAASATVADALAQWNAQPPYAVALNTRFVPKSQYASQSLQDGDALEIIAPVTGG